MLKRIESSPGLLFGSFLFRNDLHTEAELSSFWESKFGESFKYTPQHNPLNAYYSKEMGPDLSRIFFLSATPVTREALLKVKLESLAWEQQWSQEGSRRVNVDIGLLSLENFLLATTKNYSHRVYLGDDIFADLTYIFQQGSFHVLPWTYPDFDDPLKREFLEWGRGFLLNIAGNRHEALR